MSILIALICLGTGLFTGWYLGKRRLWGWFLAYMFAGMACFAYLILIARDADAWAGVGYVISALLIIAPLELGGLLGAGIAMIRNRSA